MATQPDVCARIGQFTTIYCEGALHPSLRNLLPPELLEQVDLLPAGLREFLLNTDRGSTQGEVEDVLVHRRGLFETTLSEIERFDWPPPRTRGGRTTTTQTQCMICLGEFELGNDCRRFPCNHIFHVECGDEWLRRCTDCPICKDNVDRAIRHY